MTTLPLVYAIWTLHAILRAFQLLRVAPFGAPFVERFDWFFFHAVAYDILWSLPWIAVLLLGELVFRSRPRAARVWLWSIAVLYALHLILVVSDQELMRYMAQHVSVSHLKTYVNSTSIRDIPSMVAADRGGPYLPLILGFGAPFALFALWYGYAKLLEHRRSRRLAWRGLTRADIAILMFLPLAGLILIEAWGGTGRRDRLLPFLGVIVTEVSEKKAPQMSDEHYAHVRDEYRHLWQSVQRTPHRVFPLPDYPFFHSTPEWACAHLKSGNCSQAPAPSPSAPPWNIILLLNESHRALQVGHLRPYGAIDDATPFLDKLAARSNVWTNHSVNGLTTLEGFFSAHCSMWSKGWDHVVTSDTSVRFDCLPDILRRHGYFAHFATAFAPDWDNQTFWIARWYNDYHFSRDEQSDLSLYRELSRYMRHDLNTSRPFLVTAMTKTNHFPFNSVDDMTPDEQANTPNQIHTTMRYNDRSFREFVESIEREPWFARTLIIVTGDHGVYLGEHGYYSMGDPLHHPTTWVPLVIHGNHPRLGPPGSIHTLPTSHVDIAPTVLDLLGFDDPVAFVGHSLVPGAQTDEAYAFASHLSDIVFEQNGRRWFANQIGVERANGLQVFDTLHDFSEEHDLSHQPEYAARLKAINETLQSFQQLVWEAIRGNHIVPAPPL